MVVVRYYILKSLTIDLFVGESDVEKVVIIEMFLVKGSNGTATVGYMQLFTKKEESVF